MAVFASDNFNGTSGQSLPSYNPLWIGFGGDNIPFISSGGRVRPDGDRSFNRQRFNATPTSPDYSVSADVYIASTTSGTNNLASVGARIDISTASGYWLDLFAPNVLRIRRMSNNVFTVLASTTDSISVGQVKNLKLEITGDTLNGYLNGVLRLTANDTVITAKGLPGFFLVSDTPSDSRGYHLDNWQAEESTGPQDLNVTPVYSESYVVKPTLVGQSTLDPAAVYSEFHVAAATLTPVVYPLNVVPVYSEFYAVKPTLTGSEAPLNVNPVYSEFHVSTAYFTTGQVIEPQPVYSEFHVTEPVLEPGPVEIDLASVYSEFYVAVPTLAMALTLNPDSVYSEFYVRKPTLKSRKGCCGGKRGCSSSLYRFIC